MNVSVKSSAATSASTTVIAMGRNIFPSTPLSDSTGTYTSRMTKTPKNEGLATAAQAFATRSAQGIPSSAPSPRWNTCSTSTTAPSTRRPKSTAPRLMRLPDTPRPVIAAVAPSIATGIVSATTTPARPLPRVSSSTRHTRNPPSARLRATVRRVASTSSLRS